MDNLVELYCHIDDYYKANKHNIAQQQITNENKKTRNRPCNISISEIITILVLFHQIRYKQFKSFYYNHLKPYLTQDFPTLPSYNRLLELIPRAIVPMCGYLSSMMGKSNGINYIDSTKLVVCDNKRINQHKVFKGIAERGKSSMGWFYGFKLHAIINDMGELVSITVTKGNVDDRTPVKQLCQKITGKLFGDKGYIKKDLTEELKEEFDITLITKVRKNMNKQEMNWIDKRLLKRRSLVETVFDELKNLCQIEHSRHRSVAGFMSNLLGGLIAYCWQVSKPTLRDVLLEKADLVDDNNPFPVISMG